MRHPRAVHKSREPEKPNRNKQLPEDGTPEQRYGRLAMSNMVGNQQQTLSAQDNPPVTTTAKGPPKARDGLANSRINSLSQELRLAIIQLQLQDLRKVAIVPKSIIQRGIAIPTASSDEPSLVYTTESPLSKTCHDLHTAYSNELKSQVLSCKIPTLILHVHNFDFSPLINELFPSFEDVHREYFNARAGTVRIRLTITGSFFPLELGEAMRSDWLLEHENEQTGMKQWLEWRQAEEKAGRGVGVAYEVKREVGIEDVDDMEALRMFMLLFDPYSRGEGEIGDVVQAVIEFFAKVRQNRRIAQRGRIG